MTSADSKCVLIVEDDDTIRALVSDVLARRGYRVETAADGLQGLEKASTTRPDAIVLDLRMPILDGWAFLERFRGDPHWRHVPVVVMSAYLDMSEAATRALQVEAVLAKPFDIFVLAETVARVLEMPTEEC